MTLNSNLFPDDNNIELRAYPNYMVEPSNTAIDINMLLPEESISPICSKQEIENSNAVGDEETKISDKD
eukprot:CAMPEP_0114583764 /NCGR_PEP_ID=MMETSP0125-20121206/7460_1 /TAXON_ID=485358 ORGANISM="Aristerostoma sp., Strain ATCC 50986" /NCGR_SAMPLE_ID=MMETSP0125 /ASSEMBLY_ACC=CAM_ASM_000245 /LENGTH=68 /DNA_ID=CAMNT_0001777473 /DNA_START=45 /DNA_END=251 /DNA_ORIENTATION=+